MIPNKSFKYNFKKNLDNFILDDDDELILECIISETDHNEWSCFVLNIHEGDVSEMEQIDIFNHIANKIEQQEKTNDFYLKPICFCGDY